MGWLRGDPEVESDVTRVAVHIDSAESFLGNASLALSRDGRFMVYRGVGPGGSGTQLWLRRWNALEAAPIPGSEAGFRPAISPDQAEVAFVVPGRAIIVQPLDGGSPRRQFSLGVAGWTYLLATDKGGKKLPSRSLGMCSFTSPAFVDSRRLRLPLRWVVRSSVRS